ncbi:hypothetical protein N2152v2_007344 [Parachlorella kessleri]
MAALTATSFAGARLQARTSKVQPRSRAVACVRADATKYAAAAMAAVIALTPAAANAGIVEDLLAKSDANKDLHNQQRLASSNANFARSRTVSDRTCTFPNNFLGCDLGKYAGDVKFIADKKKTLCQGTEPGLCADDMNATKYTTRR